MIDGIRNWIGDVASGKIKDAHIALTQEQATVFKRQLDEAVSKNALLTKRVRELESENQELKAKLAAIDENEEIDDQAYRILEALFNNGPCAELPRLAASFHLSEGEAEYFLDELRGRDFIDKRPVVFGGGGMVPVTACILSAGRAFVMKRRSKT